jgi:hypothetical protein
MEKGEETAHFAKQTIFGWTFLRNEAKGKRQNRSAPEEDAVTVCSCDLISNFFLAQHPKLLVPPSDHAKTPGAKR